MKGTRPLDNDEIRSVSTCFTGTFEIRNRGLFMLGVSTGGRISELLSLQIGDVSTTQKYLGVNYADARAAVESIALISESDRTHQMSDSIEKIDDQTLLAELKRRGYNLTRRRDNETTAEIVKIG